MILILFLCLFVCSEGLLNLPEGAPCVYNGLKGKCIPVKLCPTTAMVDIPQKKPLPEICSYGDIDPIICCTDCEPETKDPKKAVITVDGYRYKTGKSKAWDECLEHIQRLDFNCKKRFRIFRSRVDSAKNCTGPATYVAMGILRRSDPEKRWNKYKVKRFISHPQYSAPIKYHDIALIETETLIKFTKEVLPICLAEAEVDDSNAQVVGWGALGHNGKTADTLQKAQVQKFTKTNCDSLYPVHRNLPRGVDVSSQTCYGDRAVNADTCRGDSGGPLQVERESVTSCVSFIVGVTSYGSACGFKGGAGIYTKVLQYLPWIESIVWP